ncbi:uncharacterized protein LOC120284150 [Dioscorea cayenensis subsp. rotundata]|uniref:Uncharacterized protein LOC120284150 n=1 Tax=Dioscorea cayennensis subsp. rotundata TaxID=55577 RepID=A0AB40D946_DIOCR|nr:uncharacterized protein LOC120284150 [Dioscorea cayenensis subsp. rotundata]
MVTDKVSATNPGSVVTIENDGERFKHAFFSFGACLLGFKHGCRPLLFIDGTHLLAKYGGILLGATAKDGNEGLFHVAFAIVDNENDENWTWFLTTLREALYGKDTYDKIIAFISDRSKGLVNAIARVFLSSPHGYCLQHLEANFMKTNSGLGKAFANAMLGSNRQNCECDGARCIRMWQSPSTPGLKRHDIYQFKLMNMLAERREQCNNWGTHLCPEIRKKVEQIVDESHFLRVGRSTDDTYEVIDNNNNAVGLQSRSGSCRRWEVHGLPCKHACVAIMQIDTNIHSYVADYFTVEWYHRAYANPISPVPDSDKPSDENRQLRLRPLISMKQSGRLRRERIGSQAFDVRELHCSQCREIEGGLLTLTVLVLLSGWLLTFYFLGSLDVLLPSHILLTIGGVIFHTSAWYNFPLHRIEKYTGDISEPKDLDV